ncbi:YbbR-like domain-containing protein [Rhodonellum sp.]|uniref:YbbR-like domain-containing protein n=1 Tax=Rhodonellum sp. TaxID=2231180 RepID=UPI0027283124|nr:YbbR-like domain-containing protein [Rhodonellum sp.]MDO9552303.1 YbbR-like domain-containing protein [Rhodonellum sp.]
MNKLKKLVSNANPKKVANMKVVALCLLAATTFWLLNALNKDNYTTVVDYPIEIIYDKEEFMAVEKLPARVKIEINGNGWDLLRKYFKIKDNPFLIEINNPSTKNYLLTSEIRRSLAEKISPTSLVSIVSDTIKFKIDKVVTRKIDIRPDTTSNTLAKNFRYASQIAIDPPVVSIKGPTSILEQLEGILAVNLGEEKINKNFSKILPLTLPDAFRDFLTMEDESVHFKFEVVQFLEGNKRLKVVKTNFPENVTLVQQPNTIMMYYLIDERKVNELKEIEFEAILNYSNRNRQDSTVSVQVSPKPSFLENVKLEPEVFRLKYD